MTEQVMWKVPAWELTFQLPQQTVIVRTASQGYFPSAQVSKLVTYLLQWSSLLFEAIFSLIILLHVKTANVKGNDHQLKKLSIVKQILYVSTLGNVWRTVWRICIMMLGCKGLSVMLLMTCIFFYGHLILVSFTSWYMRRIKSTLVIWHIAGKPYNWLNFIWSKTWRAIEEIS